MKKKTLKISSLEVKSFNTFTTDQIKGGNYLRIDGGDSIMECPTGCTPGDHCQPEF